jgi:hypothetical protein
LLGDGKLVRLLRDHHRLLVYSEYSWVDHATHVHTRSRVHTTGKATRSCIQKILHLQTTELAPKGCGIVSPPLTLEADGADGTRERYVVARVHAHAHAHCHTHPRGYVHGLHLIIVLIVINGTRTVDDIAELLVSQSVSEV